MPEDQAEASVEAEYTLESPATCPVCRQEVTTLNVVRMLRTRVNFTSTLPRRGIVLVCPQCGAIMGASLSG